MQDGSESSRLFRESRTSSLLGVTCRHFDKQRQLAVRDRRAFARLGSIFPPRKPRSSILDRALKKKTEKLSENYEEEKYQKQLSPLDAGFTFRLYSGRILIRVLLLAAKICNIEKWRDKRDDGLFPKQS